MYCRSVPNFTDRRFHPAQMLCLFKGFFLFFTRDHDVLGQVGTKMKGSFAFDIVGPLILDYVASEIRAAYEVATQTLAEFAAMLQAYRRCYRIEKTGLATRLGSDEV